MNPVNKRIIHTIIKDCIKNNGAPENSDEIFSIIIEYEEDVSIIDNYLSLLLSKVEQYISYDIHNVDKIIDDIDEIIDDIDEIIDDIDEIIDDLDEKFDDIYDTFTELTTNLIFQNNKIETNIFTLVCHWCLIHQKNEMGCDIIEVLEKINENHNEIIIAYNDLLELLDDMDENNVNVDINNLKEQKEFFVQMEEFIITIINDYEKKEETPSQFSQCDFDTHLNIVDNTNLLEIGMDYEAYKRLSVKLSEHYNISFPYKTNDMIMYNTPNKIEDLIKIMIEVT